MKKQLLSCFCMLALSLLLQTTSQSQPVGPNALMPATLRMETSLSLTNGLFPSGFQTAPDFQLTQRLLTLADSTFPVFHPDARHDELYPYEFDFKPITRYDVLNRFDGLPYTVIVETEDGTLEEIEVASEPDYKEIKSLLLLEDWHVDETSHELSKDVIAYAPVRYYYPEEDVNYEDVRRRIGFFVDCRLNASDREAARMRLRYAGRSVSLFSFHPDLSAMTSDFQLLDNSGRTELDNSPFFSSYSRKRLARLLIEQALDSSRLAFDLYGNALNKTQVLENLGQHTTTFSIMNLQDMFVDTTLLIPYRPDELRALYFVEDIYIDTVTFYMEKQVLGMAPLRTWEETDADGELVLRQSIPFILWRNDKPLNISPKNIELHTPSQAVYLTDYVGDPAVVERLVLEDLQISNLSDVIFKMQSLKELNLAGNPLVSFPSQLCLPSLRYLNISGTQIHSLPARFSQLTNLEHFICDPGQLTDPSLLRGLSKLQELDLSGYKGKAEPLLKGKTSLRTLYLSGCGLKRFPPQILEMKDLLILDLSDNEITAIPESIEKLSELRALSLSYNPLTAIPSSLRQLKNLAALECIVYGLPEAEYQKLLQLPVENNIQSYLGILIDNTPAGRTCSRAKLTQGSRLRVNLPGFSVKSFVFVSGGFDPDLKIEGDQITTSAKEYLAKLKPDTPLSLSVVVSNGVDDITVGYIDIQ